MLCPSHLRLWLLSGGWRNKAGNLTCRCAANQYAGRSFFISASLGGLPRELSRTCREVDEQGKTTENVGSSKMHDRKVGGND